MTTASEDLNGTGTKSGNGTSGEIDVASFDLMSLPADFVPEADRYFAALHAAGSIHRHGAGSFVLMHYDDLVTAYGNPSVWSSDKILNFKPKFADPPFKYSALLWVMASGFLAWGGVTDGRTLQGGDLLTGSGHYLFHREGRQSARLAP